MNVLSGPWGKGCVAEVDPVRWDDLGDPHRAAASSKGRWSPKLQISWKVAIRERKGRNSLPTWTTYGSSLILSARVNSTETASSIMILCFGLITGKESDIIASDIIIFRPWQATLGT